MIREPVEAPAAVTKKQTPAPAVEANTAETEPAADAGAEPSSPQEAKTDQGKTDEDGIYDDNWAGGEADLKQVAEEPAAPAKPKALATQPASQSVLTSTGDPYAADERELDVTDDVQKSDKSDQKSAESKETSDPYKADDRELN